MKCPAITSLAVALLALTAVAPAVVPASSPPQPLCSVCDDGFERAADERGLQANVTHGEATVRVREDGTGLWTVRNRLENESVADRLRNDPDRLDRIVRTALGDSYRKPNPNLLSNVSTSVRNQTVVVTFAYENFADHVGSGVLLVEYFHADGRRGYGLVADRFAVIGPEGSRVLKGPDESWDDDSEVTVGRNATATGGSTDRGSTAGGRSAGEVVWTNYAESDEYHVDSYVEDSYIAFGPHDGLLQGVALRIALVGRALPTVLGNLALLVPSGIALAVGFGGYRSVVSRYFASERPTRLAAGIFAIGLLAVGHPFYAGSVPLVNDYIPPVTAAGVAYALVAATALSVERFGRFGRFERFGSRRRISWWWLLAPALATPAVAAPVEMLVSYPNTLRGVSETILFAVPLAATFPLGYAFGGDAPRAKRRAAVVAFALVAALPLRFVSFTEASVAGGLVAIIAAVLTLLGLLFGAPLYLLGGSLASAGEASD
ncbi:hypothetical protein [Halorussus ruber]|uniref:hypothetical protein n=1 Tax=Halorussus ruber TaxID=1126238 RepID=UPI001092DE8F|nr:hypothetical protein [Halorussus ruber]